MDTKMTNAASERGFRRVMAIILTIVLAALMSLPTAALGADSTSKANTAKAKRAKYTIAIDAGHQKKAMLSKERVDPDRKSLGKKYKVSGGCSSAYNGMPEYKYTLKIAKQLKKSLEAKGYKVYMTRTKNNVKISNQTRAKRCNKSGAVLVVRLHCDSAGSSAKGVSVLYKPRSNSYYSKSDAKRSKVLAKYLLNGECKATGFKKRGLSKRNDLTGCNWSKIPCALVEMGFFSNKSEAKKMAKKTYQKKIVKGLTNGIEKYMKKYYL